MREKEFLIALSRCNEKYKNDLEEILITCSKTLNYKDEEEIKRILNLSITINSLKEQINKAFEKVQILEEEEKITNGN